MEKYYKLRIDYSHLWGKFYPKLESKYLQHFVRVKESPYGSNPHFHYYLETVASEVSIRSYIRTNFGSGNGVYSLKLVTYRPVEYVAYLMKDLKSFKDFEVRDLRDSESFIQECKEHHEKVKFEMIKKKEEKKPMWFQCMEYVNEHATKYESFGRHYNASNDYKKHIVKYVVQFYKERKVLIRRMQLVSVVDTILVHNSDEMLHDMENSILEKII